MCQCTLFFLSHCRYAFSSDVARALVETHAIAPLKFMPNEDATFGFWVMVCIHAQMLTLHDVSPIAVTLSNSHRSEKSSKQRANILQGMNLRRIDHPRAKTPAGHCCWG